MSFKRKEEFKGVTLYLGDSREVLRDLPPQSIHSVVTDPPYALVSISKRFGSQTAAPSRDGDVYARSSSGFMGQQWDTGETSFSVEFWDLIKTALVHGGHVAAFGGTRTYHRLACAIEDAGFEIRDQLGWLYGSGFPKSHAQKGEWEGWGTALKPAWEPICLARKNIIGTVQKNLDNHGAGALNIEDCRIVDDWSDTDLGRWPANVVHDGSDDAISVFPELSSKFLYCAKASSEERDYGLHSVEKHRCGSMSATIDGSMLTGSGNERKTKRANIHPTVKPVHLMRWLARLVTKPDGIILDPFMGSGSTGIACAQEGFKFIGIEMDEKYFDISCRRIEEATRQGVIDM